MFKDFFIEAMAKIGIKKCDKCDGFFLEKNLDYSNAKYYDLCCKNCIKELNLDVDFGYFVKNNRSYAENNALNLINLLDGKMFLKELFNSNVKQFERVVYKILDDIE